jgi:hypothetical protein
VNKLLMLMILLSGTGCALIFDPIGFGATKKSPKQRYEEHFGTLANYPGITEVKKTNLGRGCKYLGDYRYESSWKYEDMKLVFYKYVKENLGNTFVNTSKGSKTGLLSELNKYEIRYYLCKK